MLEYAIKEIVKEDAEEEKRIKEEEKRAKEAEEKLNPQVQEAAVSQKRDYTKLAYMLVYIPLVLLLVNYLVI